MWPVSFGRVRLALLKAHASPSGPTRGTDSMLNSLTTNFIGRLRANDQAAWFELWETFGPVLRAQITKWGKGRIGAETVRDLSQETLAALSDSIDRFDPGRGARFSTWLLAIAKHVLGDEMDRRMAQKRGGGQPWGRVLEEGWMGDSRERCSVDRQLRGRRSFAPRSPPPSASSRREADFTDFSILSDAGPGRAAAARTSPLRSGGERADRQPTPDQDPRHAPIAPQRDHRHLQLHARRGIAGSGLETGWP